MVMKKLLWKSIISTALSAVFAVILSELFTSNLAPVTANMAPPAPPVGSDLSPGFQTTNVRMVEEFVLIDISGESLSPSGHANVTANFTMRNLGNVEETMRVRFPLHHNDYDIETEFANGGGFCKEFYQPGLRDLRVWVNSVEVETDIHFEKMVDVIASPNEEGEKVYITAPCWAFFEVSFPPEQDVFVTVTYSMEGYRYISTAGRTNFKYVITTGAGWKDEIGKADIVARLPYEANHLNVNECFPKEFAISGREVSWHFEEFEPLENISLFIINPLIWRQVVEETENTQKNPEDGEAWGRLGKAYLEAQMSAVDSMYGDELDHKLFELSRSAFQRAVELVPDNPEWHYKFAELLFKEGRGGDGNSTENWYACLEQLKWTLDLAPDHPEGNDLLFKINAAQSPYWLNRELVDISGDQPDFLLLSLTPSPTQTPTQTPSTTGPSTPTTTLTNTSAPTVVITKEDTKTPTRTPKPEITQEEVVEETEIETRRAISKDPAERNLNVITFIGGLIVVAICVVVLVRWRR
jgi:tetratricopeptide (TPR) repeat protein